MSAELSSAVESKYKAIHVHAWTGPEGPRKLRL